MEEFTSKIDTWLLIVFVVAILVSVGAAFLSISKSGAAGYMSALLVV